MTYTFRILPYIYNISWVLPTNRRFNSSRGLLGYDAV